MLQLCPGTPASKVLTCILHIEGQIWAAYLAQLAAHAFFGAIDFDDGVSFWVALLRKPQDLPGAVEDAQATTLTDHSVDVYSHRQSTANAGVFTSEPLEIARNYDFRSITVRAA
jgi:hypothetical protein